MENNSNSSAMNQLQQMAGLESIKKQFEQYRNAFKWHREGKTPGKFHQHMAFMGNPGTGKTTVARLFAEILHEDGLLPQGQVVYVSPNDLISPYIGQTGHKTQAVCEKAKGGVLIIDEAYALMNDIGREAIEVLIPFMMNNDDSLVILVGYTKEMEYFLNHTGIGSHLIAYSFHFEDYTNEELSEIFCNLAAAEGFVVGEDALTHVNGYFMSLPRTKNFDNAPEAHKLLDIVKANLFQRLSEKTNMSKEEVSTILPEDFPQRTAKKQLKEELMLLANELQEKLQQLQSKLNELSEE